MTKIKTAAFGLLTAGLLATGIASLAQGRDAGPTAQESPAPRSRPRAETTVTYYVGDLILVDPSKPVIDGRPQVDMSPVIDLITSTIEPGHWKADDGSVRNMTPFFLSLSLIVRCDPEVHEKVHALLMGLRRFAEGHAAGLGLSGKCTPRTYEIGDLLRSPGDAPDRPDRLDRQALIAMIASTIHPRFWQPTEQGTMYVVPGDEDDTLVVCHTPVGHEQVEALFASLRRFRDAQASQPPAAD